MGRALSCSYSFIFPRNCLQEFVPQLVEAQRSSRPSHSANPGLRPTPFGQPNEASPEPIQGRSCRQGGRVVAGRAAMVESDNVIATRLVTQLAGAKLLPPDPSAQRLRTEGIEAVNDPVG